MDAATLEKGGQTLIDYLEGVSNENQLIDKLRQDNIKLNLATIIVQLLNYIRTEGREENMDELSTDNLNRTRPKVVEGSGAIDNLSEGNKPKQDSKEKQSEDVKVEEDKPSFNFSGKESPDSIEGKTIEGTGDSA